MADGILGAGKDFSPEKIFHLLVFAFIYKISHSEENIFYVMADILHGTECSVQVLIVGGKTFLFHLIKGSIIFIKGDPEQKADE
ncbi:hypothetical protein [Enterocloster sp.]|uniref:hypothetical protein n=1 Tax=Enterocloster sp. TaxID=2719315 RepID=UPI00307829C5